jgi:hypothetical protein
MVGMTTEPETWPLELRVAESMKMTPLDSGFLFPSPIAVWVAPPGCPAVDVVLAVEHGEVVVTQVVVSRADNARTLDASALKSVPIRKIIDEAKRRVGMYAAIGQEFANPRRSEGYLWMIAPGDETFGLRPGTLGGHRRGVPVTDAELQRVAEIVRSTKYAHRAKVADELHLSLRTASRWIAEARRRGFLNEENDSGD